MNSRIANSFCKMEWNGFIVNFCIREEIPKTRFAGKGSNGRCIYYPVILGDFKK